MIYLLSSSPTRASLMTQAGFSFKVLSLDYDESAISKTEPVSYVYKVLMAKLSQAKDIIDKLVAKGDVAVLADSCVGVNGRVLSKASSQAEARQMLLLQSANSASVFSAMAIKSANYDIISLSQSTFEFKSFEPDDLDEYINSGLWQGKAGAMMIEGFNAKYIKSQKGSLSTAMGLDIDILKAFL